MVTRGAVAAEGVEGGFSATYRVLSVFEESGQARRGYVVEGLGAAQFAMDGAVDRLRAVANARERGDTASGLGGPAPSGPAAGGPPYAPFGDAPRTGTSSGQDEPDWSWPADGSGRPDGAGGPYAEAPSPPSTPTSPHPARAAPRRRHPGGPVRTRRQRLARPRRRFARP